MIWFDRLLWLSKLMEPLQKIPGMSLICVGRKGSGKDYRHNGSVDTGRTAVPRAQE